MRAGTIASAHTVSHDAAGSRAQAQELRERLLAELGVPVVA